MSYELKAIPNTARLDGISVTRFFAGVPAIQFTQGMGGHDKAGFIQIDREQAVTMIARLAEFLEEGLER